MTKVSSVAAKLAGIVALAGTSLLAACGGGDGGQTSQELFASKMNSAFSRLGSWEGLSSASVIDLFDADYLDSGTFKSDVKAALDRNTAALTDAPELSLFPLANVSNVSVSDCDGNNNCTLSGTLTNTDADTTEVRFSTKVKSVNGVYYFFGDQLAS